ncbi:MAG: hypothetical protein C0514_00395 [Candidatus Puniceispirillum sp.]|nr:hypothetical protein [Candidatus Puniceispirillum sp.]
MHSYLSVPSLLLVSFLIQPCGAAFEEDLPCGAPPRAQAEASPKLDDRVESALRAYAIMRKWNVGWRKMGLSPQDVMNAVLWPGDASYDDMRKKAPEEDVDNLRQRLVGGAEPVDKVVRLLTEIARRCVAQSRSPYLDEVTSFVCLAETKSQLSMLLAPDEEADRLVVEVPY